jgi:hypothetical protein
VPLKIRGYGTNMQNWDKYLRQCVVAPPGYVIWQIDQGGADALIVAYLCKMGRFRSLFINGIKPHVYVALHIAAPHWSSVLGLPDINEYLQSPIAELKSKPLWPQLTEIIAASDNESNAQKRFYYIAKTCCHLLNYDAMWRQFQLSTLVKSEGSLVFSDTQAKYYRDLYRETLFPEITNWHCEVIQQLDSNGRVLYNLFGHPRKFHGPWDRELWKVAYAFIPQSTVAIITLEAQREITQRLDNDDPLLKGVSIIQNGHDAIVGYAPEDSWRESVKSMVPHIERELMNFKGEKFRMRSGTSVGRNWGPFDLEKNPLGVREYDWKKGEFK